MAAQPLHWADRSEIFIAHGSSITHLLAKQKLRQGRSQRYYIRRRSAYDQFFIEIVFSAAQLAAIKWNVDILRDLG